MEHPYDSRQIANRLIRIARQSGESMSIMRVLKLAYMAHGWTLATIEGPLVNEYVQAWRYGPVIPSIYYAFRPRGVYDLDPYPLIQEGELDSEVDDLMVSVFGMYRRLSATQLSALTHIKGGPWHTTYRPGKRGLVIPNELIEEHFKDKLERAYNGETASQ